jgi:hypothetical protein
MFSRQAAKHRDLADLFVIEVIPDNPARSPAVFRADDLIRGDDEIDAKVIYAVPSAFVWLFPLHQVLLGNHERLRRRVRSAVSISRTGRGLTRTTIER